MSAATESGGQKPRALDRAWKAEVVRQGTTFAGETFDRRLGEFLADTTLDRGTVVRKFVGFLLRHLRRVHRLSQREIAEALHFANSYVAMIEVGDRVPSDQYLTAFENAVPSDGLARAAIKLLTTQNHRSLYRAAEEEHGPGNPPVSLHCYAPRLLPDFLHIDAYARVLHSHTLPAPGEQEVSEALSARGERAQFLVGEERPATVLVLEEAVLHCQVGGRETMREQLEHLRKWMEHPACTVQVLPQDAPPYLGLLWPTVIAKPDTTSPALGYVETHTGPALIDEPGEVELLTQHFGHLRAHALTPDTTTHFIEDLIHNSASASSEA